VRNGIWLIFRRTQSGWYLIGNEVRRSGIAQNEQREEREYEVLQIRVLDMHLGVLDGEEGEDGVAEERNFDISAEHGDVQGRSGRKPLIGRIEEEG